MDKRRQAGQRRTSRKGSMKEMTSSALTKSGGGVSVNPHERVPTENRDDQQAHPQLNQFVVDNNARQQ